MSEVFRVSPDLIWPVSLEEDIQTQSTLREDLVKTLGKEGIYQTRKGCRRNQPCDAYLDLGLPASITMKQ